VRHPPGGQAATIAALAKDERGQGGAVEQDASGAPSRPRDARAARDVPA
jgi:hypothetical protein